MIYITWYNISIGIPGSLETHNYINPAALLYFTLLVFSDYINISQTCSIVSVNPLDPTKPKTVSSITVEILGEISQFNLSYSVLFFIRNKIIIIYFFNSYALHSYYQENLLQCSHWSGKILFIYSIICYYPLSCLAPIHDYTHSDSKVINPIRQITDADYLSFQQ